jgi:hypothetical protein
MTINSKKDTTRKGMAAHSPGSKSGRVSMLPSVVVPWRKHWAAPCNHDSRWAASSTSALRSTMALIQSVKERGAGMAPTKSV